MQSNAALHVEPLSAAHDEWGNCAHPSVDCLGYPIPELVRLGGGFAPLPSSHGPCRSRGKHGHKCMALGNVRPTRAKAGRYAGEWISACCCSACIVKPPVAPTLFG